MALPITVTYIAANPLHDTDFHSNEWYSATDIKTSTILYDLGDLYSVNRMAFWNEDLFGTHTLRLEAFEVAEFSSGVDLGLFVPTDNPVGVNYGPDDFAFAATNARYFRLTVTNTNPAHALVSLGEIAFRTGDPVLSAAAPEPATFALLGVGMGMFGLMGRRHKR
jgi:hypothetical protein